MVTYIKPTRSLVALDRGFAPLNEADYLTPQKPDYSKVAVLLNRNARRVTDRLARKMERLVGSDNLYYSQSLEEAEAFTREIVQRNYGTVVCGGGDGTLMNSVKLVQNYVREANDWRMQRFRRFGEVQPLLSVPRFAFLRLGTGNAIAGLVGSRNSFGDLRRIVDYAPMRTQKISLIENGTERFFFGGVGYDATLLNDYDWLKAHSKSRLLKPFLHGLSGYFTALATRTLPRILSGKQPPITARITSLGRGYYVDPRRGDWLEHIEPGTVIFEGDASMIAAGTAPFFGYNVRMFPFAGMQPGMMQLRVTSLGAVETLLHLPSIWRGHYRNAHHLFDFLVDDVRVELSHPHPFEYSGDAQGERDALHLQIARDPLELVDLRGSRPFP